MSQTSPTRFPNTAAVFVVETACSSPVASGKQVLFVGMVEGIEINSSANSYLQYDVL